MREERAKELEQKGSGYGEPLNLLWGEGGIRVAAVGLYPDPVKVDDYTWGLVWR